MRAAEEYAERFAHYHNPAAARWSGLRAVALERLGMKRKALELAAEELDRARDWGAPGTVARSLRVLGTLEGADGIERLEEAVDLVSKAPSRLELAKSLAALGVARKRAGRPDYAGEPLLRAHTLAEVCGAEQLLARVRTEMLTVGVEPASAVPRGVGALTETERRVAALAAAGPRRAGDRAGAVRHPAHDRGQARQRPAQARGNVCGRAGPGAGNVRARSGQGRRNRRTQLPAMTIIDPADALENLRNLCGGAVALPGDEAL